jgi:hypothetical protein
MSKIGIDPNDGKTDFQIGFWAQVASETGWGWRYYPLIERNTPCKDLAEPRWIGDAQGHMSFSGGGGGLNLGYSETGNPNVMPRRIPLNMALFQGQGQTPSLSALVPGWENKGTRWAVGFSVKPGEDDISGEVQILVHFKNLKSNQSQSYSISQIRQLADQVLVHDPAIEAPYEAAYKAFMARRRPEDGQDSKDSTGKH